MVLGQADSRQIPADFRCFPWPDFARSKEEGVYFHSHIDGHKIFMGPEESMQIQSNLASTIAMAFDECPPQPWQAENMCRHSVDRTTRWLERCKAEMSRLNGLPDTINKEQLLFGINQGAIYADIRIAACRTHFQNWIWTATQLAVLQLERPMRRCIIFWTKTVPHLPQDKPTYLMGVGTPANILEGSRHGEWTSLTVYIQAVTDVMAMYTPITASSICLMRNTSWIPSHRGGMSVSGLPAITAEPISATF